MLKRLPRFLTLTIVVWSLAGASWASDESAMLKRTTRESRMRGAIGPAPEPLPVASPAVPGDDDMPERTGQGPKNPGEAGAAAESQRDARWLHWMRLIQARWIEFMQR